MPVNDAIRLLPPTANPSTQVCLSSFSTTTTTTENMALNAVLALLVPLVFLFVKLFRWGRRDAHLPPGPPTTPFLGNILQLPSTHIQLQCALALLCIMSGSYFLLQIHRVGPDLWRCYLGAFAEIFGAQRISNYKGRSRCSTVR